MSYSTKAQNGAIGGMVAKMKLTKDAKAALIFSFSDGRTETTPELYFEEAHALIKWLKEELKLPDTPKDRMARAILSLAHEMNWRIKGKVDINRVNTWCIKYGYLHKKFNDYDETELPTLLTQFQRANKDYHKGI